MTAANSKPKMVKAISTLQVYGKVSLRELIAAADTANKIVPLYRVFGRASSFKTGETDKGAWTAFIGEFKAIVGDNTYISAKFFPPSTMLTEMLQGALGNSSGHVDFAFDIGAHFDETAIAKYVYDVESLLAPKPSDALAMLEASIAPPSLPAPHGEAVNPETGEVTSPAPKRKRK